MSVFDDLPGIDGVETPLVWQELISVGDSLVVPIGLYTRPCPTQPHNLHYHFLYLTQPNFLERLFGRPGVSVATRYHVCLN